MTINFQQNSAPAHPILDKNQVTSLCQYIARAYPRDVESSIHLYKKGDWIYKTGQPATRIYEVVAGVVCTSDLTKEGEEVTTDALTQNDLFGNFGILNGPFTGNAKALIDTRIRFYDPSIFSNLRTNDPIVNAWFNAYILSRCKLLEKRLLLVSSRRSLTRVDLLFELFDKPVYDAHCGSHTLLNLLTQKDLADLAGTTRQTIANMLKKMGYKRR